jgi:predicted RNA-binding protein YlxR (DUF448 family)
LELVRFTAQNGVLTRDPDGRRSGRGAYVCRRSVCFERAEARRAFARTLRRTVTVPSNLKASLKEG